MLLESTADRHNNKFKEDNRKRHNYSSSAKQRGKYTSKFERAAFLAWDGEGIQKYDNPTGNMLPPDKFEDQEDQEEDQAYGLMGNSDKDYLIDTDGLSTDECLSFLTHDKYSKHTIHVCFGASYDINMMLKDLPEESLLKLHKGDERVRWNEYDLEYRPRKSLSVTRYKVEIRNGVKYRCYDNKKKKFIIAKQVTLWDVFGFFQKKFIAVLKEWTAGTEFESKYADVIKDIEKGKDRRGNFTEDELMSFVLPYCLLECEALKDVMGILQGYLQELDLVLSRWDGAGAIAAAAMQKYNVKSHIRTGADLDIEPYPEFMALAAEYAYFGGWIEAFMIGDIRHPVYHYDVRSAYPSETIKLDSLTAGEWKVLEIGNMLPLGQIYSELENLPSFWVAHVEWSGGPKYGPCPFSWRTQKGNVTRPVQGRGWQWSPEVMAAYKLFPQMEFKVDKVYYFVPGDDNVKPFAFVAEAYELRRVMKELGRGIEKVIKLYLNSLYGKLAQSLGYNKERDLKPPYHSLIYAGLITSGTRAKLLHAAMQNPMAIISIATDGIYSLAPLDLDIGESLGQWEFSYHDNITVVQPGVYWYETDGVEKHYYRGFNEGSISRKKVIQAYKEGKSKISVKTKRFITLGSAVGLRNFGKWRKWITKKRDLDLLMTSSSKRTWKGVNFLFDDTVKVTTNRVYDPRIFASFPYLLESSKYEYDWDEDRDMYEGLKMRTLIEEMFTMELCTDG